MRGAWLVAVLLAAFPLAGPAFADPPPASAPAGPAAELERRLTKLMRDCRRCQWGLLVKDLESGRVLFEHNARLPFNPASNAKIVTAAAALSRLGPDHRFVTRVLGRIEGDRVVGGLYLQGGSDPSLLTADLAQLAGRLRQLEVRTVEGPLYLDTSGFGERDRDPPGFRSFRSSHSYRAGVDALSLNGNVIRIAVAPGEELGAPGLVTVAGESEYLSLRLRVITSHRTRLRVGTAIGPKQRTVVQVSGRIALGSEPLRFWRRVYHPSLYAGHAFRAQLSVAGVEIGKVVQVRAAPLDTPVLVEHRSESLAAIIRRGNKRSSNVVAEHLLLALGADVFGLPATFDKGRRAVGLYLKKLGLRPGSVFLENGSGLSRRSRIRPADLVTVLERAHDELGVGPDLLTSLPVAGLDGTLLRRFEGSQATGFVRAKTGTLSGISCLSGYAGFRDRRLLVFSLLAGRVRRLPPVRRLQAAMAEGLVEYLRQHAAGSAAGAPRAERSDQR
jgi:serine-type D-Ala-D-Ala carboxypeptidase/endopeptidase (penicillin-binding protein 4)